TKPSSIRSRPACKIALFRARHPAHHDDDTGPGAPAPAHYQALRAPLLGQWVLTVLASAPSASNADDLPRRAIVLASTTSVDNSGLLKHIFPAPVVVRSRRRKRGSADSSPLGYRGDVGLLKELLREQYLLVRLDEERAIQAIPKLLPPNAEERRAALNAMQ